MRPPAEPASGSKALVYNECDQLTSWPGMYAYEYDSAGNLIRTRARSSSGPIAAEYTYTDDGLLHTASCGGTTTLTNTWDAMGNRVGLTVGSDQYSFLYNPIAGVPAVLVETGPDTTYYYYRDPRGVLIARFDTDPLNEDPWRYYHYDELGSTRLLTDEDGEVTDEYAYDAYGNTITHLGTTQDNPYQWVGALGYYTHHQAPEFRLIQLGFRFYDPEIGRFTQQDPIGDGLNWYAYAEGNPIGFTDSWGGAIGEPPWYVAPIPIVGSGWEMVNDFQNGDYVSGAINAGLLIGDLAGVGVIGKGAIKVARIAAKISGPRVKTWAWKAVRGRLGRAGLVAKGQHVHHWAISRNGKTADFLRKKFGKGADRFINGAWNQMPMKDKAWHDLIEGKASRYGSMTRAERWLHGTPDWWKGVAGLGVLSGADLLMQGCECP